MGVSGAGKTTLGMALASRLGWDFLDADDFHPAGNVKKMASGIPLSDADRAPWLATLHQLISLKLKSGHHPVLACSALKEKYRIQLLQDTHGIETIYLRGDYEMIWSRMAGRQGHYMKPELLQSQFAALEEPENVFVLDVSLSIEEMIDKIVSECFLRRCT